VTWSTPEPAPGCVADTSGSEPKYVIKRMEHPSSKTTLEYLHTLPNTTEKNLRALDHITK
jgi:hypothetical protein